MLDKLATELRFMQLFAHNAHNLIKGNTFFEDHEFLGGLYSTYEDIYDGIIERMIGIGETPNLLEIQSKAVDILKQAGTSTDAKSIFTDILQYEKYICTQIEKLLPNYSEGTKQMLGNVADASEMRQYKLKQRIG